MNKIKQQLYVLEQRLKTAPAHQLFGIKGKIKQLETQLQSLKWQEYLAR